MAVTSASLKRRISTLPLCHGLLVLLLFISGGLCLALDITALSEKIGNCPVINNNFVPFWFHAGVSILQLSLALLMIITLTVLACRPARTAQSSQARYIQDHLVGAVGSTGQFITFHPENHPPLMSDGDDIRIDLIPMDLDLDASKSVDCCGRKCHCLGRKTPDCCTRIGWLQPITVILLIIIFGQVATLIWFCQARSEVTDPREYFSSRIINLFVEVKVDQWKTVPTHASSAPVTDMETEISQFLYPDSAFCWFLIQNTFFCCGPSYYTDWAMNYTQSSDSLIEKLPRSCFCPEHVIGKKECQKHHVVPTKRGLLYTKGCLMPLSDRLFRWYTTGIIIIPCSIILLLFAFLCDLSYTLCTARMVIELQEEKFRGSKPNSLNPNRYWTNMAR